MKTIITPFLAAAIIFCSCSSDDESSAPSEPLNFVNLTETPISDAISGIGIEALSVPVTSTIAVTQNKKIQDPSKVTVTLNLVHSWCGDLVVELIAPNGETTTLIKRLGALDPTDSGDGSEFHAGNLISFNSTSIMLLNFEALEGTDPFQTGVYAPTSGIDSFPTSAVLVPLQEFLLNKQINGNWQIRIQDYGVDDDGSLVSWKLDFAEGALK